MAILCLDTNKFDEQKRKGTKTLTISKNKGDPVTDIGKLDI
jgi:hypothetical protein